MENMLIFAGIWMLILPKMKWNVLKDKRWVSLYSYILGIYTLIITIILRFSTSKISNNFFILCYILLLILNIILITVKIKTERSILSKLMRLIAYLCICLSLLMLYLDRKEIISSIVCLTAAMIMLWTPYDVSKKRKADENTDRL